MPAGESAAEAIITFKLEHSKPIDLLDLTGSLAALGEAYRDYVARAGYDVEPGNVRLFVRELRTGSIIADLVSMADQASLVLSHLDAAAGFITHFDQILRYFLLLPSAHPEVPTKREAAQAIAVLEPVAKDGGANLFLNVSGECTYSSPSLRFSESERDSKFGAPVSWGSRSEE